MDQLGAMRTFAAVALQGGFAAAARHLDLAPAVVTRRVADLEQALGARLFTRSTRRVALTGIGQHYLDRVQRILREVDEAADSVRRSQGQLRGRVRLLSPPAFAAQQLMPRLARLQARHPGIALELNANGPVETLHEAHDISLVVRQGALDGDFVAHALARSRLLLCAAPAYLARCDQPTEPAALAEHALLLAGATRPPRSVRLRHASGAALDLLPPSPCLASPNAALGLAGALAGLGIAALPSFAVHAELQQGRLQTVLPDWQLPALGVFACVPVRQPMPAAVRAVLDFLREEFPGGDQDPWCPPGPVTAPIAAQPLRLAA
jgi:DNA-binding transcriptional LysR family regulator